MIVVGIDSTPRRANEYLPYPDPNNKELGKTETQDVQGKQYGDFVINEVMPLIQKKYRVLTGAHITGIGGVNVRCRCRALHRAVASRRVWQGAAGEPGRC